MEDYPIPKPKPLLEEIRVVRQGMQSRLDAEREIRRERARESLMAGNRRFWTEDMISREDFLAKERASGDWPQSGGGSE